MSMPLVRVVDALLESVRAECVAVGVNPIRVAWLQPDDPHSCVVRATPTPWQPSWLDRAAEVCRTMGYRVERKQDWDTLSDTPVWGAGEYMIVREIGL